MLRRIKLLIEGRERKNLVQTSKHRNEEKAERLFKKTKEGLMPILDIRVENKHSMTLCEHLRDSPERSTLFRAHVMAR